MHQESRQIITLTRGWIADIEGVLASRSQLDWQGVLVVLGLATGLFTIVAAQNFWGGVQPNGLKSHWPAALSVLVCGSMLLWIWRRGSVHPRLMMGLWLLMCGLNVLGVAVNGELALLALTAIVVALHVMLSPLAAGVLSASTLVLDLALLMLWHPQASFVITVPVFGTTLAVLIFLQMAMRNWLQISTRFQRLGNSMSTAVELLESSLEAARTERDAARLVDAVTGLPNRAGFLRDAQGWIDRAPAGRQALIASLALGPRLALQAADSDDERCTRTLALVARLRDAFGSSALLACTEADHFLLLVPLGQRERLDRQGLAEWLQHGISQAASPGPGDEAAASLVGVVRWPQDGMQALALVQAAEMSRLWAERSVGPRLVWHEASRLHEGAALARQTAEMREALRRGEFMLHYQPIVGTEGTPLQKFEALIRWNHPQRGRIAAGEFIPLAERTDLIVEITAWVLQEAARQSRQWRESLNPDLQISVNLAPSCLERLAREPERVRHEFQALGAPRHALVLEITEGAMLEPGAPLLKALDLLREAGFLLAMDDFGTGYSSFGTLAQLDFDFLKLDKSFVDRLETSAQDQAVCLSIIELAHQMGMQVIAEGVETAEQDAILRDMDCDFVQGYLWSRPLPAFDAQAWVQAFQESAWADLREEPFPAP